MDDQLWYDRLETTAEDPGELFEHFETRESAGHTIHVLPETRHGLERGTVIVERQGDRSGTLVRGYPSVPRLLVLDPGVPEFFDDESTVAIEEKLDGFNVRIADVGEVLAFTRGGYVCPYTTGRARALLDTERFFADHPEKMLCAELIGPETPYTTHDYEEVESHAFRVFGIRDRDSGEPLPVERRQVLCEQYGFEQPPFFGWHDPRDAPAAVWETILDLDERGREGVLLKSPDSHTMVKYTTERQHHAELAHAFSLPFEYGRDFLFSRLLREAFQAAEFDDPSRRRERARDLGESILLPMVETIEAVEAGETVGERHTVRGKPERVEALLAHLQGFQLTLAVESDRIEAGERVVEFRKVADATQDNVKHYLAGGVRDE